MPAWLPVLCVAVMLIQLRVVDLHNITKVCKARVKRPVFGLCLAALTLLHAGVMTALYFVMPHKELFTVLYSLSGLLLLIPLRLLLTDSLFKLISALFTAKGFTLLVLTLSALISRFFSAEWLSAAGACALTALLVVFSPWYSRFYCMVFKISEKKLSAALRKKLLQVSVICYATILFTYLSVTMDGKVFSILSLLGLGAVSLSCFSLLYASARASQTNTRLTEIVYTDNLTGLDNRTAFFQDGQSLINNGARFEVVFLDLNRFKLVNDRHGHLKGNEYLIGFAQALRELVGGKGKAYRLSGDEFILLVKNGEAAKITTALSVLGWHKYIKHTEFLGVSAGCAAYPLDGGTLDSLVCIADKAMYENKRGKVRAAVS